jgi:hypothetical protein
MQDAVRAREAANDAISDIEPPELRASIETRLAVASMTPGVLTLVTARETDAETDPDATDDRAAGVQLIYEGLRLTRSLACDEPWAEAATPLVEADADLSVLAADVLVARGFYLLAKTDAAAAAVEVVRTFGRDQTLRNRDRTDVEALDQNLEKDVLELAITAGTITAGDGPPEKLLSYARDLTADHGGQLPPADKIVSEAATTQIASLSKDRVSATDP